MIARLDRVLSSYVRTRFDSPDNAAFSRMLCIVWGAKAEPPVLTLPRRLCCVVRALRRQCVMSGRVNWSRIASRDRMRRQGVEDVKGGTPLITAPAKKAAPQIEQGRAS